MEERRLLLAVALSLLVLTAYQFLFPPPAPRKGVVPSPAPSPRTVDAPATATPATPAQALAASPPVAVGPVATVGDERERRVEVEGAEVAVAFSNRGARLLSWKLKKFRDPRGRPEEMVQTVRGAPLPLDLETGDAEVDRRLREVLYLPSREAQALRAEAATELSFRYAEGELEAEKQLRFQGQGYLVEVRASVRRQGRPLPVKVLWGPGLGNPTAEEMAVQGYHAPQVVYSSVEEGIERVEAGKLGALRSLPGVRWAGVESTYFAALWVPPGAPAGAEVRAVALSREGETAPAPGPVAAVPLAGGEAALLYVGPKDHALLARLGHGLADVVPVGEWIGPLVVPLLSLLRWVHGHVGNYGWSIVLLTVVINVLMAPLRHYSIANGLKMAKLAPEMRVIQERYRKVPALDPRRQQMQQEIAALYGRHGMSMGTQMAVGCLPILLTMPFLIAFYRVLTVAVELRGATFLWIPDLSQRDPYFLTPVLMGVSMFIMQKMTPTTMDPAQQRIMMIMPLVLTVMFFAAPAGLNLYWLASNVCSIAQQGMTLRLLQAQDAAAAGKERKRA